ncbi:MAG: DUF3037 domain-containing protein [Bacteroidetes bacterium]|nr:DUF3037 domain-containing protein [Bacteroidota bacterium]
MQEKHLFEYAIIRLVPRVEREEFINVGVILYCAHENFLQTKIALNKNKLGAFSCELDMEELVNRLHAFEQICKGAEDSGPIGKLPIASRFRWLTATRSTIIQISPVHPGLCINAAETMEKLFEELVK